MVVMSPTYKWGINWGYNNSIWMPAESSCDIGGRCSNLVIVIHSMGSIGTQDQLRLSNPTMHLPEDYITWSMSSRRFVCKMIFLEQNGWFVCRFHPSVNLPGCNESVKKRYKSWSQPQRFHVWCLRSHISKTPKTHGKNLVLCVKFSK